MPVAFLIVAGCGGNAPAGGRPTPQSNKGGAGGAPASDPAALGGGSVGGMRQESTLDVPRQSAPEGGAGAGGRVVAYCGDGLINQTSEVCDDGNDEPGDGCTASCDQVEVGWACPTPGKPCVYTVVCGDGRVAGTETCDFGKLGPNAACNERCQLQPGWSCPSPGYACVAGKCGDGILAGTEDCEFSGSTPPAGCSSECRILDGYACSADGLRCHKTVCGDKTVERGEQCDDGNEMPYDGCYRCRLEPSCSNGVCVSSCGDGQRFADEECDDGNTRSGDGCSTDCIVETGFTCTDRTSSPSATTTLPVLVRDFVGANRNVGTRTIHPDFNSFGACPTLGMVATTLGTDGRPVLACPGGDCKRNPGAGCLSAGWTGDSTTFDQWFRNTDNVNLVVVRDVTLARQSDGTYKFDSDDPATTVKEPFDPAGSEGWVGQGVETLAPASDCGTARNVSFTSETHFWFEYRGGERFDFSGDDDTWIFLNRRLAIDLGGLHTRMDGYFVLDADTDGTGPDKADGTGRWASPDGETHMAGAPSASAPATIETGMVAGGIYEVVVFQAERRQCESNFRLTLRDFARPMSACASKCGDGVVASNERCDDGVNKSQYGGCGPGCIPAPFCGDGVVASDSEECDDGVNTSLYGGCAPGCHRGPSCGDGLVQAPYEECDDGQNEGAYGKCGPGCHYGPRCGDGVLQAEREQCDQGDGNGTGNCMKNCQYVEVH